MADPANATSHNERRRSAILRAAAELLGERGFADARVADIAHRAGVSAALVIYYFGTREKLLISALSFAQDMFYQHAQRQLDTVPALRDRLSLLVTWICMPAGRAGALCLEMWAQALRCDAYRADMNLGWRNLIAYAVEGELTERCTATNEFAVQFAALLDGLWIQLATKDPELDAVKAREIAMRFAERELLPERVHHL